MLSVKETYLKLAELWSNTIPDKSISMRPYVEFEGNISYGLCFTLYSLYKEKVIGYATENLILDEIDKLIRDNDDYCWPLTEEGAKQRVKWCLEQAALIN